MDGEIDNMVVDGENDVDGEQVTDGETVATGSNGGSSEIDGESSLDVDSVGASSGSLLSVSICLLLISLIYA